MYIAWSGAGYRIHLIAAPSKKALGDPSAAEIKTISDSERRTYNIRLVAGTSRLAPEEAVLGKYESDFTDPPCEYLTAAKPPYYVSRSIRTVHGTDGKTYAIKLVPLKAA